MFFLYNFMVICNILIKMSLKYYKRGTFLSYSG